MTIEKEENDYSEVNHIHGKVPGKAKNIDKVDANTKQKRLIESGWEKYMKTKKDDKSGGDTNPFSIVLG